MEKRRLFPDKRGRKQVTVYRRKSSFYARFAIHNRSITSGARYITETLATHDFETATQRAWERLATIRVAEKSGHSLRSNTVAATIDDFITAYQDGLAKGISDHSVAMLRGFRKTIVRYWRDYLGKLSLSEVTHQHMVDYERWRVGYWERWLETKRKIQKGTPSIKIDLPTNARVRPSRRTLVWEINAFKQFLRWAQRRGKYHGDATLFVVKKGTPKRRSGFTSAEYNRLTSAMRRKEWLQVGKHKNDPRLVRYREMLRAYVLFMANTGLRVGEARNLKWADVTFAMNENDETICRIWVAQSHAKIKKRREVVAMPKAAEVMRELCAKRTERNDFSGKNDFIWCDETGKVIRDFREGFNNLLLASDTEFDADGSKHTLYSLRHFYITERLKSGVLVYAVADNCGTSVSMIEKYYSDARSTDFVNTLTKSRLEKKPSSKSLM